MKFLGRLNIPFFPDEPANPTLEGEIWMDSATDQPRWKTWDTPSVSLLNGVKMNDIASNRWYMTQIGNPTTANWTVSRMYAVPLYMTRYGRLINVAVDVSTAHTTTAGTLRAGIYYGDKYNTPTTLLQDFGTTAATVGIRTWTAFTRDLAAGQYWLVIVPQGGTGGTPQFRSAQGVHEGVGDTGATPSTTFMNGSVNTYYSATTVAGALPASFGTIGGAIAGPRIAVRFGAT
jgi:hypothetical protein